MSLVSAAITYVQENVSFLAAFLGGLWALWEFRMRRIAERKKLAADFFERFKTHPDTVLATKMLDWNRVVDLGMSKQGETLRAFIDTELLAKALSVHQDKSDGFNEIEVRIRDIFDGFLTELEMLDSYVGSKLLKDEDIKPFVGYWIKAMQGTGGFQRPGLPEKLEKFVKSYGYEGVEAMLKRY